MSNSYLNKSNMSDAWIQQALAANPPQKNAQGFVLSGPVRLSFCDSLFEAKAMEEGKKPLFSSAILWPRNVDLTVIYNDVYAEIYKSFPEHVVNNQIVGLHTPFRDQALKQQYEGYTPGALFTTCSSEYKPPVVMPVPGVSGQYQPVVDRTKVYPGVWAIVCMNVYSFNYKNMKKGVSLGLQSVVIIADDERLGGGGSNPQEDFAGLKITADMNPVQAFSGAVPVSGMIPAKGVGMQPQPAMPVNRTGADNFF